VAIHAYAAECTAPHVPSQMSPLTKAAILSSSNRLYCHLSTTPMHSDINNYIFPTFRAGLLEPHGSESCTRHNRDLIRTPCMCGRNAQFAKELPHRGSKSGSNCFAPITDTIDQMPLRAVMTSFEVDEYLQGSCEIQSFRKTCRTSLQLHEMKTASKRTAQARRILQPPTLRRQRTM
jgi:hypothetical protein